MATLKDLSNDIAALVEKASKSVVRVDARRGRAGTGIVWDSGLVLTANHVVEQEDDIEVVVDDKSAKATLDRKSTRLNSSHLVISYAVFCLKKKNHSHSDYLR